MVATAEGSINLTDGVKDEFSPDPTELAKECTSKNSALKFEESLWKIPDGTNEIEDTTVHYVNEGVRASENASHDADDDECTIIEPFSSFANSAALKNDEEEEAALRRNLLGLLLQRVQTSASAPSRS